MTDDKILYGHALRYCCSFSHLINPPGRTVILGDRLRTLPLTEMSKMSPITGPRCPEGSRKLRFPDYVTVAQGGGKVNRHEHQEYIMRGKGDRYVGLTTLPISCADCLNIS